jgi:hypothetical protein
MKLEELKGLLKYFIIVAENKRNAVIESGHIASANIVSEEPVDQFLARYKGKIEMAKEILAYLE